ILSYSHGANTWRFGGAFRPRHFDFNDASNFGGTFTFSSLGSFSAGSPELFEIIQGNPKLSFSQNEAYGFLEDDVQIGSHTNLMAGLRYDWQQRIDDHNNFAPRLALGFSPGTGKTVFRVGGGMFYDHMSDSVTERTLLLNGVNASEFILQNPAFPTLSLVGVTPSIWSAAPQMQTPYLIQGSTSVEHGFGAMKASVEYQFLRGIHLFRARDINTPLAGTGRPDPNLFLVRQAESTASSRSNSLSTSFQGRIAKPIKIKAQYTFSHSNDDTDGPLVLPADSRDLSGEWGRSLFDIRHRFTLAAVADLPKEFRVGTLFSAHSAPPFNITTGADSNGNGIVNDRPAGVTRNTGQGFGFTQLDLRLTKTLYILGQPKARGDKSTPDFTRLELSLDAFNVFNQANFTDVIGVISSPRFGLPTAAFQPRTLQLSAKIIFRSNRE
ncbi:MAG TPA: hypothetical protein VJN64_11770, partial [Terriglobales bacterium]|nr:hypothetical protein [Terriglobales bacterium]